jgi:hypothetical protein
MIKNIIHNDEIFAIILRTSYKTDGVKFFTPDDFSQQLGYMSHPSGHVIKPHIHNTVLREVQFTNEVLFVKSGKVRVDFYDNDKVFIENQVLTKGDVILLASGGHGFEMLEDSEIIEVKQGPYSGENDKTRFEPFN